MAIIGVLLGVTMTILAWLIWQGRAERERIDLLFAGTNAMTDRIAVLERRKAVIQEAVATQAAQTSKPSTRRQWSEDVPAAE